MWQRDFSKASHRRGNCVFEKKSSIRVNGAVKRTAILKYIGPFCVLLFPTLSFARERMGLDIRAARH